MSRAAVEWVNTGSPSGGTILPRKIPEATRRRIGPATVRRVLVNIAHHADRDGVCWPGNDRIARETDTHPTDVQKCVTILAELGLIEQQDGGKGPGNCRTLQLLMPEVAKAGAKAGAKTGAKTGALTVLTWPDEAQPRTKNQELKDDDDARDKSTGSTGPPQSSSSVHSTARAAAKRVALLHDRTATTAYVHGIMRNWRTETDAQGLTRYEKLALWEKSGVALERQIELVIRDAPVAETETAPPPSRAEHPPNCRCNGEGIVRTEVAGHGTFARCEGR